MSGVQTENIQINGVQKTNVSPIEFSGDVEIFDGGVIGGSVSDEFHDALRFAELFEQTGE